MGEAEWQDLWRRAVDVLDGNRLSGWTRAAPRLYPHQWSWDSAFIAIGLVHVDPERAIEEMRSLFRGQWRNGMLPHIVFNPDVPDGEYFPGPDRWACEAAPDAPSRVRTSGIVQPPVHAIAVHRAVTAVEHERQVRYAAETFRPRFEWHRYLPSARETDGAGRVLR